MVMDVGFFADIARQVKEITDHVYLHVMGEPLLHPRLKEILDICHEVGLNVNLTTNGTKLLEVIDVLKEAKALRKVAISIQALEANGNNGWKEYLDQCVEAVSQLPDQVIVEYRLWNWDHSAIAPKEVEYLNEKYHIKASYPELLQDNKYNNSIKLKDQHYIMFGEQFVWPVAGKKTKMEGFCPALRRQLGILVDGSVVPCCLDSEGQLTLGNLHEQSLSSILESKKAKSILDGFSKRHRVMRLCQQCEFINEF